MALKVSLSVSVSPEMVDTIDEQKGEKSRSEYIRDLVRDDQTEAQKGAA